MTAPAPAATWLTTADVIARARKAPSTVRMAAIEGQLHGHQSMRDGRPVRKGKWLFHTAAVDAWLCGLDERTQAAACGCVAAATSRRMRATS